ncbi:MAG: hypothetical protein DVB31_11940 [Verrucomicrobia bacterium]|nr:MAG: hypothetical protein DVB31_11940 [Verrucomicrobiota bacterium]
MHTPINRLIRRLVPLVAIGFLVATGAQAADPKDEPMRGPFWSGTIMRAKDKAAAMKGLAITLDADRTHHVVYDLDTLRLSVAWSGDFLEFGNTLTKIEWPPPPSVKGTVAFDTAAGAGWADPKGSLSDPRVRHQGPLPKDWVHYEGLVVNGSQVVLRYTVGGKPVLELPSFVASGTGGAFTRTIQFEKSADGAILVLASGASGTVAADFAGTAIAAVTLTNGISLSVDGVEVPQGSRLETTTEGTVVLRLGKIRSNKPFRIALSSGAKAGVTAKPNDLRPLLKGGPARWTTPITTQGIAGNEEGPYQVDTLTEPFPNPYNTRTFWGGFDFLPDGRAAICAFHGDVWIVSGLGGKLGELKWKRFATGLFQPLGLKVVKGDIYVAGRDQITRLRDVNGDGEADAYDNFNNDTVVTANYHEFVLDLHTDSKGNFYYAKGAPWEPSVTSPHQGTLIKVSRDGKTLEVVATGLRAPNGMTVGPDNTILVGDNQGHWMPSSKLNLVKPGAFLGMVPSAQRELTLRYPDGREIRMNPSDPEARAQHKLKGWDASMPIPTAYDEPICWLPMRWDNSSGGQVYVTGNQWGPWKGAPLFLSYGKCLLYGVLWDEVDGTVQAAMTPFGLRFQSGVMRARFNPRDGQLYACGLKGWQNAASRDGGFYRVRYTGKPVRNPIKAHVAQNGIQLTFASALDRKSAEDAAGYAAELWNYRYSGGYGSPEVSVKTPAKAAHDKLEVKGAHLSADGKTLFLEIEGLEKADQWSVKYAVTMADGTEVRSEVIGTIKKLGPAIATHR